jgi:transposase
LKRWGFTPQRPLKKAFEQSPVAVSKWLNETYSNIAKHAKTEHAEIQWGDENGLRSDDMRGRGYAPRGKTPVVRANVNLQSLSVLSTITNKGKMRWKVFFGALNAKILLRFLKRLTHGQQKKIILILANLRVHHCKLVPQWLAKNADKIEVFYLPSYSPELNPDELLNADLNQRVTKIAAAAADPALGDTVLPRTSEAGSLGMDAEALHCVDHFFVKLRATIEDQVARRQVVGKGIAQVLDAPGAARRSGHIAMKDTRRSCAMTKKQ